MALSQLNTSSCQQSDQSRQRESSSKRKQSKPVFTLLKSSIDFSTSSATGESTDLQTPYTNKSKKSLVVNQFKHNAYYRLTSQQIARDV